MVQITHLNIDWLDDGSLPLYEVASGQDRVTWYEVQGGCWSIRCYRKLLISLELDIQYRLLERALRDWLDMLKGIDDDGSIVFPIRTSARMTDGYHFILAGMAFVSGVSFGAPLNGIDPVPLIVQACDDEILPENAHPIVREACQKVETKKVARLEGVRRARQLLTECLSPQQLEEFETHGYFHTVGADGHLYRIEKGYGHNVFRVENGRDVAEYCIINTEMVPDYDLMLAQKLLLETSPGQFEATANIRLLHRLNFS